MTKKPFQIREMKMKIKLKSTLITLFKDTFGYCGVLDCADKTILNTGNEGSLIVTIELKED